MVGAGAGRVKLGKTQSVPMAFGIWEIREAVHILGEGGAETG